ncbi:hypothetical protein, partial [Acinetobacter baumannii]
FCLCCFFCFLVLCWLGSGVVAWFVVFVCGLLVHVGGLVVVGVVVVCVGGCVWCCFWCLCLRCFFLFFVGWFLVCVFFFALLGCL